MTKTTCLLRTLACLSSAVAPAALHGQELIANGNFEGAGLSSWEVSAPAGTTVATINESSPFRSPYPAGTKAARLTDDDSDFDTPYFRQAFAPQAGIQFSFDFKAAAAAPASPWYVIWRGDEDTTAFFFAIGGQDGVSIQLNQSTIAALEANLWYHVEGLADAPNQTISGSIANSRGERITFTSGFPFGVQSVINGVTIADGDQTRNEPVIVDNFSAQPVALATASLNIAPAPDGRVTVSWTAAGYLLQGSAEIGSNAQWATIQTDSQSFTTGADQPTQFFRLIAQ